MFNVFFFFLQIPIKITFLICSALLYKLILNDYGQTYLNNEIVE